MEINPTNSDLKIIKDDMLFKPYSTMGGYQCIMNIKGCRLSVRYGGYGLITEHDKPYEVWYPTESSPTGRQTADDIWNYIKTMNDEKIENQYQ